MRGSGRGSWTLEDDARREGQKRAGDEEEQGKGRVTAEDGGNDEQNEGEREDVAEDALAVVDAGDGGPDGGQVDGGDTEGGHGPPAGDAAGVDEDLDRAGTEGDGTRQAACEARPRDVAGRAGWDGFRGRDGGAFGRASAAFTTGWAAFGRRSDYPPLLGSPNCLRRSVLRTLPT